MTGQYKLSKESQYMILSILAKEKIDIEPSERVEDDEGIMRPRHAQVSIHISSYEDEEDEYNMYVTID